jgi:oxygen-independent coproporphyrinogen-3 oxidase
MADGSLNSSLHNLQYWRNLPYLGFGTGAHGWAEGIRMANITALQDYILRSANPGKNRYPMSFATADFKSIGIEEKMQETMMLGLRLTKEGVSKREFFARFGVEPSEVFGRQIVELVNQGLLEELEDERQTIRLTKRGRLLGNRVFMNFVGG